MTFELNKKDNTLVKKGWQNIREKKNFRIQEKKTYKLKRDDI